MRYYRNPKNAIDSFRILTSSLVSRAKPRSSFVQQSSQRGFFKQFTTSSSSGKITIFSLISRPSFQQIGVGIQCSSSNTCWRRFYNGNANTFRPRPKQRRLLFLRNVAAAVVISSGVVFLSYYGHLEKTPYSKDTHFVLVTSNYEKRVGQSCARKLTDSYQGKFLPKTHPDTTRVGSIAAKLVTALHRDMKEEHVWSKSGRKQFKVYGDMRHEDGLLDDKWVGNNRDGQLVQKNQSRSVKAAIQHIEGLEWGLYVIDDPSENAFCLPGGKIVVFTGLLRRFQSEDEVAAIIGHEVAHVVARHHAGKIVKSIWYGMVMLVASFASGFDLRKATKMSGVHWKIPFSRRMEKEADYVSLMLMASAGYDPQITPAVYEKLADASTTITTKEYLSTHPSLKKRARSLAQTKVMEEAVSIYKDFRASRGVADFIDREDQNENEKENSVKYLDGNSNEEDSVGKDDYELCNEEDSVGKDDYEL